METVESDGDGWIGPKSHEIELGHIPDWHIWDLKSATLQFLLPRLQAFKRFHVDGKAQGIPIWVAPYCEREQPSEIELSQKWIEILDQMILGFEVIATPSSFSSFFPANPSRAVAFGLGE